MPPLTGTLAVDFCWYLPGPFASRELLRLGARVVKVEPPGGDPMRAGAPAWYEAINAGKEVVACDLKTAEGLARANALCAQADVVLDGFRPGVLDRLGVAVPERAVLCSITGFGAGGRHESRAGHDVNYLGWAAALLDRERRGTGARIVVSMTHGSHRLVAHRLGGLPERLLTGGAACYRIYECADGRYLTVGSLEPKFWQRLCELVGVPELAGRQFDEDQEAVAAELSEAIRARPLADWLGRFDGEDVCAGPVWTIAEAAA